MLIYKKVFIVFLSLLFLSLCLLACVKFPDNQQTEPTDTDSVIANSPSPGENKETNTVLENTPTPSPNNGKTDQGQTTNTPSPSPTPTKTPVVTPKPTPTPTPTPTNSMFDILKFSQEGGFYNSSFNLTLSAPSGYTIYYTTDGTDPKVSGTEYKGSIKVDFSETPGVGPLTRQFSNYGTSKRMTATVVRAYAKKGVIITPVISNSYFVSNNLAAKYNLPFVSISIEPTSFMNPNGIYVNPWEAGAHTTKRRTTCFVEFYNEKGIKEENLFAEISMHGHGSLGAPQKSMRIYFKKDIHQDSDYYPNRLYYDIFGGKAIDINGEAIDSYKRLVLRNSGNDFNRAMLRDRFIQKVSAPLKVDYQESQPAMLFINGEFWGMYNVREKYDDKFFNSHYGIKSEDLVLLQAPSPLKFPDRSYTNPYELTEGEEGDQLAWEAIIRYCDTHNLSNESYYQHVADQVDIHSLMDIHISNIYFGNSDWPGNNVRVWRNKNPKSSSGLDTKWRFCIMDTDMGAGFNNGPENNFLGHAFNRGTGWILTKLMTSMLQNEGFKTEFVERFLHTIDTVYHPDNTIPVLNAMAAEIKDAMVLEVARWPQNSISAWNSNIEQMRDFLLRRGPYMKEQLYAYFNYFPKEVSLVFDSSKATVKLDNKTVNEGITQSITTGQKVSVSVAVKSGNEFVSIIATDANGKQEVFNTANASITLQNKTTITVLIRKQGLSLTPQLITGSRSVYVINNKGDLYAWGSNELSQNGLYTGGLMTKPTLIRTGVVKITSAQGGNVGDAPHTIILTDDNILYSVGNNNYGQLGRSGDTKIFMKVNFNVSGTIKDISAGHDHTLILMANGDLYGIGNNQMGQLGTNNLGGKVSSFIKLASNVKAAVAGRRHTVYVDNSGRAYALGDNRWNKFSTSSVETFSSPVLIMESVKEVYSGEHQVLLLTNNSDLYYLGWRNHVSLAAGSADGKPHKIMSNVKKANMKDEHALILTNDNKAYGWGLNSYSQVTSGTSTQSTPVLIDSAVADIGAGSWFSALLYQDGRVVTWGKNDSAIAGNGQASSSIGKTIAMRL